MNIQDIMLHETLTRTAATLERMKPAEELTSKIFDFLTSLSDSYDMGTVLIALGACYHAQAQTLLEKKKEVEDAKNPISKKL